MCPQQHCLQTLQRSPVQLADRPASLRILEAPLRARLKSLEHRKHYSIERFKGASELHPHSGKHKVSFSSRAGHHLSGSAGRQLISLLSSITESSSPCILACSIIEQC